MGSLSLYICIYIYIYLSLSLSVSLSLSLFCLAHSLSLHLPLSFLLSCLFCILCCFPLFLSVFESFYLLCFHYFFSLSPYLSTSVSPLKSLYLSLSETLTKRKRFHNNCLYQLETQGGTPNKTHSRNKPLYTEELLRGTLRRIISQKRMIAKKYCINEGSQEEL